MATLAEERKAQLERDLQSNLKVEFSLCVGCKKIVDRTIDGRCWPRYSKLQDQIFAPEGQWTN